MKIINKFSILLVLLSCFFASYYCTNSTDPKGVNAIGYALTEPDKTIILPARLREISGITVIDSSSVACVQDENGVVFIFDILKDEIKKEIHFNSGGDYEGICRVDGTMYILRSDGVLFKILNYESSSFSNKIKLAGIETIDNEGLCYDPKNNRLLIAPKSKPEKDSGFKGNQIIYGYDLISDSLIKEPVINIDLSAVSRFIVENKIIHLKKNKKKNKKVEPEINLKASEIAVHPVTGKLYLLSSENHMLFVFDAAGRVEYIEKLDPMLINMPEGLSFFDNGDMLISNESGNRYPSILRFNFRNK